ncbi:MAG: hypothetical protein ACF8NJ_07820 [Phycisphaerales bacterium JB038]
MGPTLFFITALGGLLLLLLALFGDRCRGRRRCPKCHYQIATEPPADGSPWRCSECGRHIKSERHLRRTRRHWRWALVGLAIFLAAWIYPKREEFKRHGAWAAVPTIATLPFLGVLDDHWRQTFVNGREGALSRVAQTVVGRAYEDRLSWLDWKLLMWRIESGDPARIPPQPERYAGLNMTLGGEILQAAHETGHLSQARAERLDERIHVEVDPVVPWVVGEPVPARLYMRDWRRRLRTVTVNTGEDDPWIKDLRFDPPGEGGGMSPGYRTWSDWFVELPAIDASGRLALEFAIQQRASPFSRSGNIFGSSTPAIPEGATASQESERLPAYQRRVELQIPLCDVADGLPIAIDSPEVDMALRTLNPQVIATPGDSRYGSHISGNTPSDLFWVDLACEPIGEILKANPEMILALRIELWCDETLMGHASAWWGARVWPPGRGEPITGVDPVGVEYFDRHRVLFRPVVTEERLAAVDHSECEWRMRSDPMMVRRSQAYRERDQLRDRLIDDWTHYWDGEVIVNSDEQQTP